MEHQQQKRKEDRTRRYFFTPLLFFLFGFLIALGIDRGREEREGFSSVVDTSFYREVEQKLRTLYPFQEPTEEKKVYESLRGLANAYDDDYTVFFPPASSKLFTQDINGSFGGIGAEISVKEGFLVVVGVLKGSPAEKAGVQAGDVILKINGEDLADKTFMDALNEIRGKVGTEVTLTLFNTKTEETREVTITREVVEVPTLETESFSNTFIIHLWNFNEKSLPLFKKALEEFAQSGRENLLIDLRGNPGGFLDSAIDMLSYFVEQGKVLVQEDFGDNKDKYSTEERQVRSKGYEFPSQHRPKHIGVVIDSGSASASEIFAGALQDYGKAIILGEKSFGKGSVQEYVPFKNGSSLKVTVARWLTPKGRQISKKGIEPDVEIENVSELKTEEIVKKFEKALSENGRK